jgi:hypothetical protein
MLVSDTLWTSPLAATWRLTVTPWTELAPGFSSHTGRSSGSKARYCRVQYLLSGCECQSIAVGFQDRWRNVRLVPSGVWLRNLAVTCRIVSEGELAAHRPISTRRGLDLPPGRHVAEIWQTTGAGGMEDGCSRYLVGVVGDGRWWTLGDGSDYLCGYALCGSE